MKVVEAAINGQFQSYVQLYMYYSFVILCTSTNLAYCEYVRYICCIDTEV